MSRPSSWEPLTGGDPCPGNPLSWSSLANFWDGRALVFLKVKNDLSSHTSIDAQGQAFTRIQEKFAEGASLASVIAGQYQRLGQVCRSWSSTLTGLQGRADEVRVAAQNSQVLREDIQAQIDALEVEAAGVADPVEYVTIRARVDGVPGFPGLVAERDEVDAAIASNQETFDTIRAEYEEALAAVLDDYYMYSLDELYQRIPVPTDSRSLQARNPFATTEQVRGDLWEFDPVYLDTAFGKVSQEGGGGQSYTALLGLLAQLSPQELADYFESHQDRGLYSLQMWRLTLEQVRQTQKWWNAELSFDERGNYISSGDAQVPEYGMLTYEQRKVLMLYAPGLIGNLDGVPYSHRSVANTTLLHMVSSDPEDQKNWDIPYRVEGYIADHIRDTAARILAKNKETAAEYDHAVDVQVVTLQFTRGVEDSRSWNDIKTAVSIGNLDTAENASWLVHGIRTNAVQSAENHIDAANSLYDQALLQGSSRHASVAWMNYEAPGGITSGGVAFNGSAHAGGARLAQDVDTFNIVHGGADQVRTNLVGHSYGTDVVFSALTDMGTKADSAVLLGSAGLDKGQVEAYNKGELDLALEDNPNREGAKNIYHTEASGDGIDNWGRFPATKAHPDKVEGITSFSSETDPQGRLHDVDQHSLYTEDESNRGYLTRDTTALRDTSLIIRGEEDEITEYSPTQKEIDQEKEEKAIEERKNRMEEERKRLRKEQGQQGKLLPEDQPKLP